MRRFFYILTVCGLVWTAMNFAAGFAVRPACAEVARPAVEGLETVGGTIAEVEEGDNTFLLNGDGKDYVIDLGPFQFADLDMEPGLYVTVIGRVTINAVEAFTLIRPDGAIIEIRTAEDIPQAPQSMEENMAEAEMVADEVVAPQVPPLEERVDPENLAKPPAWDASWDRPLALGDLNRPEALPEPRDRTPAVSPGEMVLPVSNEAPIAKQDLSSILGELTARSKDVRLQQGQEKGVTGSLEAGDTSASLYRLPPEELMAIATGKQVGGNAPTWVGEMNEAEVNEEALQRNLERNQEMVEQEAAEASAAPVAQVSQVSMMPMFELTERPVAPLPERVEAQPVPVAEMPESVPVAEAAPSAPMPSPSPVGWFEIKQDARMPAKPAVPVRQDVMPAPVMAEPLPVQSKPHTAPVVPPVAMSRSVVEELPMVDSVPPVAPSPAPSTAQRLGLDFPSYSAQAPVLVEERQPVERMPVVQSAPVPVVQKPVAQQAVGQQQAPAAQPAPSTTGWFEVKQDASAAPVARKVNTVTPEQTSTSAVQRMPSFSEMADQMYHRPASPPAPAAPVAPAPAAPAATGWFEVEQAQPSAAEQEDLARKVGTARRGAQPATNGGALSMEQLIYGVR